MYNSYGLVHTVKLSICFQADWFTPDIVFYIFAACVVLQCYHVFLEGPLMFRI